MTKREELLAAIEASRQVFTVQCEACDRAWQRDRSPGKPPVWGQVAGPVIKVATR